MYLKKQKKKHYMKKKISKSKKNIYVQTLGKNIFKNKTTYLEDHLKNYFK